MAKINSKRKNVYKHLKVSQRDQIAIMYSKGIKLYKIAEKIKVHPSTISREIARNSKNRYSGDYFPNEAQQMYDDRQLLSHRKERLKNPQIREILSAKLREKWSPEQIAGYINIEFNDLHTNYESIYQYIYNDAREMIPLLARSHRKRQKRQQKQGKRQLKIPNRIMIDERPKVINERLTVGHWEADTAVSRQSKSTLVILRERKLQITLIQKISARTAENFNDAIISMLKNYPVKFLNSITFDNGLENARHEVLRKVLRVKTYFCNPYHSWEKGSVENTIGLIRRYLPKKTDFSLIPNSFIKYIENQLNNRPRKSLGFKTPNQVFLNCT